MTDKEVKEGKCGGKIIPKDAQKVPKDAFIYEFSSKEHYDKDGKYIQHNPGFVKKGSHPDGLCIPCCFKSFDMILRDTVSYHIMLKIRIISYNLSDYY